MAKKLTAKQRQRQRLNARLDAPFVDGSPLTYRQVARDRNAEQQLRYGPTEKLLDTRETNVTDWYDQYKRDVASRGQAQAAQYKTAVEGVNATSEASRQAAEAQRMRMDAEARADAASRGATYSGQPGQQAAAGTDVRKALADAFSALITSQGLSYGAHNTGQQIVGSAAQLSDRLATQKAKEDLAGDKAVYGQNYMAKRRDDERKAVLENAAFGLKADTAAADEKAKSLKTNKYGYTDEEWASKSESEREAIIKQQKTYGETPKGTDPAKERTRIAKIRKDSGTAIGRIEDARSRWNTLAGMTNPKKKIVVDDNGKQTEVVEMKDGKPVMVKPTPTQIRAQMQKEKFKEDEIHLALVLRAGKKLSKADIAAAHRLGIRIPREWLPGGAQGAQGVQKGNDARPADSKYGRG